MDYTSRMAALLGRFRRERNGVVADTMQYRGKAYGLNYGVSLPTIRAVARAERPDSDFARFLYRQDVRELKLAAFWIADPVQVTSVEFSDWGEGIANSEMAEECAFALMSRSPPAVQRRDIKIFLSSLGPGKTARYIEEEMTWRLEY